VKNSIATLHKRAKVNKKKNRGPISKTGGEEKSRDPGRGICHQEIRGRYND